MAVTSFSGTSLSNFKRYNSLAGPGKFVAYGGDTIISGGYKIHHFRGSSEFVVESGSKSVEVLIVAGGGGGGATYGGSGGGGGGGIITQTVSGVITPGSYPVIVGAGGAIANDGNDSSIFGLTAVGGGRGTSESPSATNNSGGSGGGGGITYTSGASGTSGQGNAGGNGGGPLYGSVYGGGGGGYGSAGTNGALRLYVNTNYFADGGNGGDGYTTSFSGTSAEYAGGGRGGQRAEYGGNPGVDGGGQILFHGGGGGANVAGYGGTILVRYTI